MEIQNRLRAMSVKRWNMVETIRLQSLAEHSFNVAMIAGEIAKLIPTVPVSTIYRMVLEHDLEEVIIGDIPTPTKKKFAKAGLNYNKAARRIFTPEAEAEPNHVLLIKMADKMEALWFLTTYGIGDHAKIVCTRMKIEYADLFAKQHVQLQRAATDVADLLYNGEIIT